MYLHLVDFSGKCRQMDHTWILWVGLSLKARTPTKKELDGEKLSKSPKLLNFLWVLNRHLKVKIDGTDTKR